MSEKISFFIPLKRAIKQSDFVLLDFVRAAKEGQIDLYYGKAADALESQKIDFSQRRYTEKGDSLIIGNLDDGLAGCIDNGSDDAIGYVESIAGIVRTDFDEKAVVKNLWITQSDFDRMKQSSTDAAVPTAQEKQDDSKPKTRKQRSDVKRVTDVIQAWEGIRALRKGKTIEEIIDNLPSDGDLVKEIEKMFKNPISQSQCYNIINVIRAYKDDLI